MKAKPLYDRIIVKPIEAANVSPGGIALTAPERPDQYEVLAAGPGRRLPNGSIEPLDVRVGDHVILGKYSGTAVKIDNEEFLVLREEDVFAIVTE